MTFCRVRAVPPFRRGSSPESERNQQKENSNCSWCAATHSHSSARWTTIFNIRFFFAPARSLATSGGKHMKFIPKWKQWHRKEKNRETCKTKKIGSKHWTTIDYGILYISLTQTELGMDNEDKAEKRIRRLTRETIAELICLITNPRWYHCFNFF